MRRWALVVTLLLVLLCLLPLPRTWALSLSSGGGFPTVECPDIAGQHLNFSGGVWTCGVTGGTVASAAFGALTGGTNTTATMLVGTGASLAPTGTGTITATALLTNPLACGPNLFVTDIAATGTLTCTQPTFGNLSDTATDAQIPDLNTLSGTVTDAQVPHLNTLSTGLLPLRCVETDASGLFVSANTLCGTGTGSTAFSALTSGTNTTAAMLVGTGASLAPTGTGTITATGLAVNGGNCAAGQVPWGSIPLAPSRAVLTWLHRWNSIPM